MENYQYLMPEKYMEYQTKKRTQPLATAYIPGQEYTGLVPLNEGFRRGSMFNNLYRPYLKEIPVTAVNMMYDERKQWMYAIQQLSFACLDLNLYLDNYPNNQQALKDYNMYSKELKRITNMYEQKYGPITVGSMYLDKIPWQWIKDPWPWENEAN